ncbi:hypothetical protein BCR36DRAFT_265003, partial [Piromyces finnis]
VKEYFDSIKSKLINDIDGSSENNISDEMTNEIKDIASKIKEKIERFNNYEQPEGHNEEALHLIDLINNYDEVISIAVSKSDNFDSLERLDKIIEENRKKFPHIKGKVENYVNKDGNGITKYRFGNLEVVEPRTEDLEVIINDVVKSKSDAMVIFTDESTGRYQLIDIKRCNNMKYKLIKHEPSFFRNVDDINDLGTLSNINNFLSKVKDK